MDTDSDDDRLAELETLEAIFPEIRRLSDENKQVTFELDLPIEPAQPVKVTFPAATENPIAGQRPSMQSVWNGQAHASEEDSRVISHLPPLSLRLALPEGYPSESPPQARISTTPQWLPSEVVKRLERDATQLWEEAGRDMVAYTYIDHLQRAAEDVFGTITDKGTLEIRAEHKLAVLDYDIKARQAAFEKETFDCGICLDPKKGSVCYKMLDCGHIFCLQCLQDFYNDAIKEGRLDTVRCLMPDCAKERAKAASSSEKQTPQSSISLSPSELLQIGLSEDMVKRYVALKYKTELEADKTTVYCPRQWCNGAARSKKHKKPNGLELHEAHAADGKVETEEQSSDKKTFNRADLLSVCEDCNFAFCSSCFQSWHGEFVICRPKHSNGELSEEEKASLEYINLHTSPCPTCNAPAQKTHGCNHMICSRCNTHFCYLCSAWLDPSNPYRHYNTNPGGKVTSCYMRLWELEEGDGDDVGLGFGGGRRPPPAAVNPAEMAAAQQLDEMIPDVAVNDDINNHRLARRANENQRNARRANDNQRDARQGNENRRLDRDGQHLAVAREAPLVLRLMDENPAPRQAERRNQPAAPAQQHQQQQQQQQQQPPAQLAHPPAIDRGQINAAPVRAVRGARGGGRGGFGGRVRGGQIQGGRPQGQGRGRGGAAAAANNINNIHHNHNHNGGQLAVAAGANGLDPAQQAWVRHFVQMALMDAEDQVEGDSDDENDEHWRIR